MSILIKGMDMPETCEECSFHCYHSDGKYVCVATPLFYPMNLANSKGIRKDFCPLVEVPEPHGDLIDRDALNIGEYEREDDDTGTLEISLGGLLDLYHKIKGAPAVIAREVDENNADD